MKFWNIIFCAGVFCLMSFSADAQPVIDFDTYSVDFGYTYPEHDLNHEFVITNKGDQDLVINNVKTSCGCTAAIPSATTIPAGATSIVSVTMTTNAAPTMHKTATVTSNDPKKPMVQLDLMAKIHQVWSILPSNNIQFGEVAYGKTVKDTIYLKNMDGNQYKVVSTKLNRPEFEYSVKEPTEQGIPIEVTFTAPNKEGFVSDSLQIMTDDPRQNKLSISVLAKSVGPVNFSPARLFFANMKVGETKDRQIRAQLNNPEATTPFRITEVITDSDNIKAEILSSSDDGTVVVKFTYTAPNSAGLKRGDVTLVTNSDIAPEVSLSYSALVQR